MATTRPDARKDKWCKNRGVAPGFTITLVMPNVKPGGSRGDTINDITSCGPTQQVVQKPGRQPLVPLGGLLHQATRGPDVLEV